MTETARVAQRRALVVEAAVDTAAEVLDESAEDPPVEAAELAKGVDRHDAAHVNWTSSRCDPNCPSRTENLFAVLRC